MRTPALFPLLHRRLAFRFGPLLLFALFAALVVSPANAQGRLPAKWAAAVSPASVRPGEVVSVSVTATIKPGYHVYSLVPVPPPGPSETVLTVSAPGLTPAGPVTESMPEVIYDANFEKKLGLHENTATFTQALTVPKTAAPAASVPLTISVRYQACNATSCLPAKTVTVDAAPLAIVAGAVRPEYVNAPAVPGSAAVATAPAAKESGSLGGFILAAFGAGLLALVTPCVFPLVPVTFAFFTKQAQGKPGGVVRLAGVYCIGIVLTFTAIGAALSATVGAAGANRLAASPWTNLVFAVLFVLFGLSLLEIVEIKPPAFLQKYAGAGQKHGGTLGVLGMGLTFVVSAFTCTAPFIGTVLVAASSAQTGTQWVRPIVGMTAFASALALPFFLLALFPSLLARLPKSGSWLSTVKGTMGFLELGAALKFLSNTDLVWHWQILTEPVLLALWTIIALAGAVWLLGLLQVGYGAPSPNATPLRRAWAGVFALAGVYFLWGLSGRPLGDWVVAFLPPSGYGIKNGAAKETDGGLAFLPTLEDGLKQAKAENKPIFIDFTGYTCTNCRLIEKNVFPNADVKSQMEKFVRVRLYTDGGPNGEQNQAYQEKTFGDIALPLYAVLTPDGKVIDHTAYTVAKDPAQFTAFLQKTHAAGGTTGSEKQTAQASGAAQ